MLAEPGFQDGSPIILSLEDTAAHEVSSSEDISAATFALSPSADQFIIVNQFVIA